MNSIAEYSQIQKEINQIKRERFFTTKLIDEIKRDFNEKQKDKILEIEKVSTSQLESDYEKLKSLINIILKVISKVSTSNQFYLSFFSEGDNQIILTIRDEKNSTSQKLISIFEKIINQKDYSSVREFELSRFIPMTLTSLIDTLQGKFQIIYNDKIPFSLKFSFPLNVEEIEIEEENIPAIEVKEENEIENEKDFAKQEIIEEEKAMENFDYTQKEIQKKSTEKLDLSKLNCLYIEDQVDSQILFKFQMKDLKDIKFAPSFEEAFPLITTQHFDFILMDINLQGEYNGLDPLKIIHNMPGYETLQIIAITAYVLPGDKEKFIESGFCDFIAKPIFREKIIESLEKIFAS
jgi:CheY-like chemotaxis protein